ncbi:MAG: hypothetical protein ACREEJ_01105 [Ensifer adhaerens]
MERSQRPEVRNPILALPCAATVAALPQDSRLALRAVLNDIADDAARRAQESWRRHKGPMAVYWKAIAVYSRHIARAIPKDRT